MNPKLGVVIILQKFDGQILLPYYKQKILL